MVVVVVMMVMVVLVVVVPRDTRDLDTVATPVTLVTQARNHKPTDKPRTWTQEVQGAQAGETKHKLRYSTIYWGAGSKKRPPMIKLLNCSNQVT